MSRQPTRPETLLQAWLEPLRWEAKAMLVRLAETLEAEDPVGLTEGDLEALIDRFAPDEAELAPAFEDFFGKFAASAQIRRRS